MTEMEADFFAKQCLVDIKANTPAQVRMKKQLTKMVSVISKIAYDQGYKDAIDSVKDKYVN